MILRLFGIAAGAACLVLVAALGVVLYSARQSLERGVQEMHRAEAALHAADTGRSPRAILDDITLDVARAHDDFQSADTRLSPLAPLLRRLSWLPRVGDELSIAPLAAGVADQTAGGTLRLLHGLDPLVSGWNTSRRGGHVAIETLVARLAGQRHTFQQACALLHEAQRSRAKIPSGEHGTAVSSALRSLDRQLPRLVVLCRTLVLLPDLAGWQQPQTYLVVYQDPNELRATGGFIGSAGILTVRGGRASHRLHSSGGLDNLSVPPPEPVSAYNGEPGWLFRDSNWSPDFPTSAALERFFFQLDFHRHAANIINVTPQAVADILAATGPIYAPEYHRLITAQNVGALADYYVHWTSTPGPYQLHNPALQAKQFIGIIAQHLLDRLETLSPAQWVRVAQGLAAGAEQGDILLNFEDPQEQQLVQAAGVSGAMNPASWDFLEVVDTNLSYNKLNPYVHLQVRYQVRIRPDRWLQARLTLHLTNGPTPARQGQQGIGPGAGTLGGPLDYATFLRVYVPAGAQLVDQSGWTQPWTSGPAYGKTMFSGYLIVRHDRRASVHLEYVVPPNVFTWSGGREYRLLVPHQPGSHPDLLRVSIAPDGERDVSWAVPQPTLDWSRTVPIEARPIQPIPLPVAPPTVVAPGHWIEPHAYLGKPNPHGPFITP